MAWIETLINGILLGGLYGIFGLGLVEPLEEALERQGGYGVAVLSHLRLPLEEHVLAYYVLVIQKIE